MTSLAPAGDLAAALPALHTLNLSKNLLAGLAGLEGCAALHTLSAADNQLADAEAALRPLAGCTALQSLDLQNNRLGDGAAVLGLLPRLLPRLKCLYLRGNPLVSSMRGYRKSVIAACPQLTFLDDRPVFEVERLSAEAWWVGSRRATGCHACEGMGCGPQGQPVGGMPGRCAQACLSPMTPPEQGAGRGGGGAGGAGSVPGAPAGAGAAPGGGAAADQGGGVGQGELACAAGQGVAAAGRGAGRPVGHPPPPPSTHLSPFAIPFALGVQQREALGLPPEGGDPSLERLRAKWEAPEEEGAGEELVEPEELVRARERLSELEAARQQQQQQQGDNQGEPAMPGAWHADPEFCITSPRRALAS